MDLWSLLNVPPSLCDSASKDFDELPAMDSRVMSEEAVVNHDHRDSTLRFAGHDHWLTGIMQHHGMLANINAGWEFHINSQESIQGADYVKGQHFNWHVDTILLSGNELDRKLTLIMLLNDGFEGGELQLQHPRKSEIETIPLVKGSIVAFPSYVLHRVTPIISGRRRSATLWLNGPRFR